MRGARRLITVVLPLSLVAATSCASDVAPRAFRPEVCTPEASWPELRTDWTQELLHLTNEHRASRGLGTLARSDELERGAHWKARHMAEYTYLQHDDPAPPVERTTTQRFDDCGYTGSMWAENIAQGQATPAKVLMAWLSSPGHRANIEDPDVTAIGIGAAVGTDGPYWVQMFGEAATGSATTPPGDANLAPAAADDVLALDEDTSLSLDLLANDTDPEGDALRVQSYGTPDVGRIENGTYLPAPDFSGPDSFVYTVADAAGGADQATVSITVRPVNDAPATTSLRRRVAAGATIKLNVLAAASDVDGDDLDVASVSGAQWGSFRFDGETGTLTYRARRGAAGRRDRLVVVVTDGHGGRSDLPLRLVIR